MTDLVVTSNQLPSFLKDNLANEMAMSQDAIGGVAGAASLPTLSISGKEFSFVRGDTRTVLDGKYLDVIIIEGRPAISKRLFQQTFGSEDKKPSCASIDGVSPDFPPRCVDPETGKAPACCRDCYFNRFGTATQGKGRACRDYKRLVVMAVTPDESMSEGQAFTLDVPATSLKAPKGSTLSMFREHYDKVVTRGKTPLSMVVTRLEFVKGLTFPQLTFNVVRYATEAEYRRVLELRDSDETRASLDDKYTYRDEDEEGTVNNQPVSNSMSKPSSKPAADSLPTFDVPDGNDEAMAELDALLVTM